MLNEVYRVLSKAGVYIVVSHGAPDLRTCFLEH